MAPSPTSSAGGGGRIRTYEGISQQIYSLPPLAAWVPLLKMSRVFCGASHAVSSCQALTRPLPGADAPLRRGRGDPVLDAKKRELTPRYDLSILRYIVKYIWSQHA